MRLARLILVGSLVTLACSGLRGRAEDAIAAADSAVAAVSAEAKRIAPEELTPLTDAIAAAQSAVTSGEFQAAIDGVAGIAARAEALGASLPEKKAALEKDWNALGTAMTANVAKAQGKLDQATRSKRYPTGLDANTVTRLQETMNSARTAWDEATATWGRGDLADAWWQGVVVRRQVTEVMLAVGLPAGDREWSNLELKPLPNP
jgi:hypothetical protein